MLAEAVVEMIDGRDPAPQQTRPALTAAAGGTTVAPIKASPQARLQDCLAGFGFKGMAGRPDGNLVRHPAVTLPRAARAAQPSSGTKERKTPISFRAALAGS